MYYLLDEQNYIKSMSMDTPLTEGGCFDGTLPDNFTEENFFAWKFTEGRLIFDAERLAEVATKQAEEKELDELLDWFIEYDKQVMQYQRCNRLGQAYDKNIAELDAQAEVKQRRIREIRGV